MIWRVSLSFLVFSLVARQSRAQNVQGDHFCGDLMCTTAFVNSTTVTYQMTALNQLGWMAVGFGTQMADAKMVIMWPNMDGSISLSQRTATGMVEPVPDPSPPRIATVYQPLTTISSTLNTLSFTVPKDDTVNQSAIWALGFTNPNSTSPNVSLIIHNDSGAFTLDLSKEFDPNDIPSVPSPPQTTLIPSSSSDTPSVPTSSQVTGGSGSVGVAPLESFEKIAIAHAVLSVAGFLVILPIGALIARWCRTFTENWFYYHWMTQVVLSIPVVITGWALGPLAVATQGLSHANDVHKILGILLLPLYIIQLFLGTYVHFRKLPYPKRHPPRSFVHGVLGILTIGLAFFQARTGLTIEWNKTMLHSINLSVFSNLWIAWVIFIPLTYSLGFFLLPRQLAHERKLPPPYSPRNSESEGSSGLGMRRLLGLDPVDDGTHDIFSEAASNAVSSSPGAGAASTNGATTASEIEMREVPFERWAPISLASSQ